MRAIAMALFVVALAVCGLAIPAQAQVPSGMPASFAPFRSFGHGEGAGYAFSYRNRTKQELAGILRSGNHGLGEMRVSCEVLVRQLVESHPDLQLPFESCEGAAAAIERDPEFRVEACRDDMYANDWLAVTDAGGTSFGVWHRRCYQGEEVLTYRGHAIISLMCLNPVVRVQKMFQPVTDARCPQGFFLTGNYWDIDALPEDKRRQAWSLIRTAEASDTNWATRRPAYWGDRVSRTMGDWLIEVFQDRFPINEDIVINYLNPENPTERHYVGILEIRNGSGIMQLPGDPTKWIVEGLWKVPSSSGVKLVSPVASGGIRRIWLDRKEWFSNPKEKNKCRKDTSGLIQKVASN